MTLLIQIHVAISLVAIGAGFVVAWCMLTDRPMKRWTDVFLGFTVATSATGFLFPFKGITPAFAFGVLSMIVLAPTLLAWYRFNLARSWRWIFVVGAMIAQYLNVFVLIVQSFQKIPVLNQLAPTPAHLPFQIAQALNLLVFVGITFASVKRFQITEVNS